MKTPIEKYQMANTKFDNVTKSPFNVAVIEPYNVPFGKKLYCERDGALHACRIRSVLYGVRAIKENTYFDSAFDVEVAGSENILSAPNKPFFESVEDYEEWRVDGMRERLAFQVKTTYLCRSERMMCEIGACNSSTYGSDAVGLYRWKKATLRPEFIFLPWVALWADEDGFHANLKDHEEKYYSSKEECIADNKVQVVEFEDEEKEPVEREFEVEFSVKVKAKTYEEAKSKYKIVCNK